MSSNIGISASTSTAGDGESTPDPTRKYLSTLTHSPPDDENNVYDEELAQTIVDSLLADQVAIIFGFLKHNEIMYARVCTTWRDAARKTLVPPSEFVVKGVRSYNEMRAKASALPNMQHLSIRDLSNGYKFADGEDPDEDEELAADTANYATLDLNIISNFRMLRALDIYNINRTDNLNGRLCTSLNGRYPVLFNFPMLQSLKLSHCWFLKWDLDMLSGFPLLRELTLNDQPGLTGDLKRLRVLKNNLEEVDIRHCDNIQGNFMDLADSPCLKKLWIVACPVTGDIRDIQEDDFPSLEKLSLPSTVIGGHLYEFQRIRDVPSFMQAIYPLLKRCPETKFVLWHWSLSRDSPDWYQREWGVGCPEPPFSINFFLAAGLRNGWRWSTSIICGSQSCEVNWLDPEPMKDSDGYDYDKYVECLQKIDDETDFYRGYYEPPTEEEYRRLCLRDR